MRRTSVDVEVRQSINYHHNDETEDWRHLGHGVYTELNSYYKIEYIDANQSTVTVKWYPEIEHSLLEIRLPSYVLYFNVEDETQSAYITTEGTMELSVVTKTLRIGHGSIYIEYIISVAGNPIGEYTFQLEFSEPE